MHLPSGTRLGPYRIEAPIGAGGMGEVYRATDTRLNREVAVKVLSSRLTAEPSANQRFEREARAASALNDPHICTIYDVGEHEGRQFLVMELLEGQTLKEHIDGQALAVERVLKLGTQISSALQTAHGKGISIVISSPPIFLLRSAVKSKCWTLAWHDYSSKPIRMKLFRWR